MTQTTTHDEKMYTVLERIAEKAAELPGVEEMATPEELGQKDAFGILIDGIHYIVKIEIDGIHYIVKIEYA